MARCRNKLVTYKQKIPFQKRKGWLWIVFWRVIAMSDLQRQSNTIRWQSWLCILLIDRIASNLFANQLLFSPQIFIPYILLISHFKKSYKIFVMFSLFFWKIVTNVKWKKSLEFFFPSELSMAFISKQAHWTAVLFDSGLTYV